MTNFKKYFAYNFRKNLPLTGILAIFAVIIVSLIMFDTTIARITLSIDELGYDVVTKSIRNELQVPTIILCVVATLFPCVMFSNLNKRNNLDVFMSFPIKREKLMLTHFLVGYINVAIIFTVAIITNLVFVLPFGEHFEMVYYIPYYFAMLGLGLMMYSLFVFAFRQGKTVVEGAFLVGAYIIIFFPLTAFISGSPLGIDYHYQPYMFPHSPIILASNIFEYLTKGYFFDYTDFRFDTLFELATVYIFWGVIGALSVFGVFMSFRKMQPYTYGQPSNAWFGFRTILPLITFFALNIFGAFDEIIVTVIIIIGFLLVTMLRKQPFKLKLEDFIVLACIVVISFAFNWEEIFNLPQYHTN